MRRLEGAHMVFSAAAWPDRLWITQASNLSLTRSGFPFTDDQRASTVYFTHHLMQKLDDETLHGDLALFPEHRSLTLLLFCEHSSVTSDGRGSVTCCCSLRLQSTHATTLLHINSHTDGSGYGWDGFGAVRMATGRHSARINGFSPILHRKAQRHDPFTNIIIYQEHHFPHGLWLIVHSHQVCGFVGVLLDRTGQERLDKGLRTKINRSINHSRYTLFVAFTLLLPNIFSYELDRNSRETTANMWIRILCIDTCTHRLGIAMEPVIEIRWFFSCACGVI